MKSIIYNNMNMYIKFENDEDKKDVISDIKENKIIYDSSEPILIYLEEFGLPEKFIKKECDRITLNTICKEYLYFSIAKKLIEKLLKEVPNGLLTKKDDILQKIKRQFLSSDKYDIKNLDELFEILNETKIYYEEQYYYYTNTGNFNKDLKNIKIPYLDIESFVYDFKKIVKNNSYICIIIDDKNNTNIISKKCVNQLMDINYDVSFTIKVLTSEDSWKVYDDLYGNYTDPIISNYEYNLVKKLK